MSDFISVDSVSYQSIAESFRNRGKTATMSAPRYPVYLRKCANHVSASVFVPLNAGGTKLSGTVRIDEWKDCEEADLHVDVYFYDVGAFLSSAVLSS